MNTDKRYYTLSQYLLKKFSQKVFKVPINAGFTCPNRDGTKGIGGCTFCSASGSGEFAGNVHLSINEQFDIVRMQLHRKWKNAGYIVFFQAFTNTYAPIEQLYTIYEKALKLPNILGISISTRPDCLSNDVVECLYKLSKQTYLVVELGLQTIHNETANKLNRCHSYKDFLDGYARLQAVGINVCVHIINGLPNETHKMMVDTAKAVAKLHPHSIKIHLLHVIRGTMLAKSYANNEFSTLTIDQYINIVCDQLEVLPPDTIIERLTGDGAKDTLIAPLWSKQKFIVTNGIDNELFKRQTYQGIYFNQDASYHNT